MRVRSARVLGAALCLAALAACDCAGPVHVDDASLRPRADASHDAAVLDVVALDAATPDSSLVDGTPTDLHALDLAVADSAAMDGAVATDSAGSDQTTADLGSPDLGSQDSALVDATATDTASLPDTGPFDAQADGGSGVDAALEDAHGADSGQSVEDCAMGGLCLLLTWNSSQGDLDLHLSFNGGAWCSDDACYWTNCADDASYHVDWDQSGGFSSADPVVFNAGRIGHGPEVLRIEDPLQATYIAAVHYQPGLSLSDVTAVVELWSLGVKAATQAHTLAPGAFWELGDILVGASSVALTQASRLCSSGWMCQDAVHGCPAE